MNGSLRGSRRPAARAHYGEPSGVAVSDYAVPDASRILLTGASGYVGGRLLRRSKAVATVCAAWRGGRRCWPGG